MTKGFFWYARRGAAVILAGLALWFCLPVLHGGFAEGSVFGVAICAMGIGLIWLYPRLAACKGGKRLLARVLAGLYTAGLLWAGYLTALIIMGASAPPPDGLDVIVLGSQVYSAERMGRALTYRVDAAYDYLSRSPGSRCIVTGGQGGDEPCPEALAAKNALVRMGIDEDRVIMEDRSRNTRQNLEYAMRLSKEHGLDTKVAVVSQSFHLYRALRLAESAGYEAYGLAAQTDPIIYPQYFGRELMSLTKWHIEEWIGL